MSNKKRLRKENNPRTIYQLAKVPKERVESRKEDNRLINQALRGNQQAYEILMKKYKGVITHLIYKIIQSPDEVNDVVQEVFINTFKSLKSYKKKYSFFSWIYKIALNKGIDCLRKKKLETFSIDKSPEYFDGDQLRYEIPDNTYEPDRYIIAKQRAALIEEAIERLPAKYKKVIVMRHQEEMEYAEIAKELKLPIGTVKVHIFRARELLNKFLKNKISQY